jgi:hypothetical protein
MITFKSKFAILAIILMVYSATEVSSAKSHFIKTKAYDYTKYITVADTIDLRHLNTYGFDDFLDYDYVTGLRYTKQNTVS